MTPQFLVHREWFNPVWLMRVQDRSSQVKRNPLSLYHEKSGHTAQVALMKAGLGRRQELAVWGQWRWGSEFHEMRGKNTSITKKKQAQRFQACPIFKPFCKPHSPTSRPFPSHILTSTTPGLLFFSHLLSCCFRPTPGMHTQLLADLKGFWRDSSWRKRTEHHENLITRLGTPPRSDLRMLSSQNAQSLNWKDETLGSSIMAGWVGGWRANQSMIGISWSYRTHDKERKLTWNNKSLSTQMKQDIEWWNFTLVWKWKS